MPNNPIVVGTKLRVKADWSDYFKAGQIVTVTHLTRPFGGGGFNYVKVEGCDLTFHPDHFTRVEDEDTTPTPQVAEVTGPLTVGQRVKVRDDLSSSQGNIDYAGLLGTVKADRAGDFGDGFVYVEFDDAATSSDIWNGSWNADNLVAIGPAPTALTITLSGEVARDYATSADSRILDPAHRSVLQDAARGEVVDLRSFQKALTAAMSSATTRQGQSTARRRLAAKIEYLADLADDALDKALADVAPTATVPSVPKTDHDRLVAELAKVKDDAGNEVADLMDQVARVMDQVARVKTEAADLDRIWSSRVTGLEHELTRANERVETFRDRTTRTERTLLYARSLLSKSKRAQVTGYADALEGKVEQS